MKKDWIVKISLGAVLLGTAAFSYRLYSFSEQNFLLKEAEEKYKITVKATQDPEHNRKLKVILLKEFLLAQYLKEKPEALEQAIQRYQNQGSLFIVDVPETKVKLLNVTDKRCPMPSEKEHTAPVEKLTKDFCFSADNVAYFKDVKEAHFRLEPIESVDSITDEGVQSELKARLKEEIKALAVSEYIQKHRGF
ncbi:MAG: hypothetical protein M3Q07_16755 [Pseudobdellovibrionaceae bacterium]|nr:hypothetical protein [Pseudobdellovibrionaceae bacterium]